MLSAHKDRDYLTSSAIHGWNSGMVFWILACKVSPQTSHLQANLASLV